MRIEVIISSLTIYLVAGTVAESCFTLYRIGKYARNILPQFFTAHWRIWKWLGELPFALYCVTLLATPQIRFWIFRLAIVPAWIFVVLTGRYIALRIYRQELQKMANTCLNEEVREGIRTELRKTDSQITEEMESYLNTARNCAQESAGDDGITKK